MDSVCSTTTLFLVNDNPIGEFKLKRGLRQGDPLPPFLFLIVAEWLNNMLNSIIEAS